MSPTEIKVRSATATDAAPVSALLNELGYRIEVADVRANITALSSTASDLVLVAEAASGIVGVITFHVMPLFHVVGSLGRISSLVVSSQWQRCGVGTKLVRAVEEFGWSQGCLKIEVTSGDHRPGAHRFYQELGYLPDERRFLKPKTVG